jgi:class 3 adenylate cyclase
MPSLPRFDVGEWLAQLGLAGYAQAFRDNDIDAAVLRTLTQDDLREIGVASVGHRRRILDAAARLGESPDSTPAAEPAAAPQPAGDRRAAERRMLTIMFCDLVDSTALSVETDPEDCREFIASFRLELEAAIRPFDGYIAQYSGDGLMAYFGYPQSTDYDAEKAVTAGSRSSTR